MMEPVPPPSGSVRFNLVWLSDHSTGLEVGLCVGFNRAEEVAHEQRVDTQLCRQCAVEAAVQPRETLAPRASAPTCCREAESGAT